MDQSSAIDWITAHRLGDPRAAEKLWNRYAPRVQRLASAWLRRAARPLTFDEQDVAISTFDALFRAIKDGRFADMESSDELWRLMATITVRRARDRLAAEQALKRQGGTDAKTVSLDDSAVAVVPTDLEATPEVAAMMADELQQLLIMTDDDELERLVILKLEGHTNDEIAAVMGYSRSTIQRMLRTVRTMWASTLE